VKKYIYIPAGFGRRPSTTSTTMNTAKDILSMALAAAVAIALYIIGAAF